MIRDGNFSFSAKNLLPLGDTFFFLGIFFCNVEKGTTGDAGYKCLKINFIEHYITHRL